jgi:hypothetical protein
VLYTVILFIAVLTCSLLDVMHSLEHIDLIFKLSVSSFIMTIVEALTAISSIFISVTLNGVKWRKTISAVVKVDRRLLSDSSTTYRKTFVFTLAQAVAVYSYVAVLYAYNIWVWKQVVKDLSTLTFSRGTYKILWVWERLFSSVMFFCCYEAAYKL